MKVHQVDIENEGENLFQKYGMHTHEGTKMNGRRAHKEPVYGWCDDRTIYSYARRFAEKNVGRGYNNVLRKFIENASKKKFKRDERDSYESIFRTCVCQYNKPYDYRYYDFYVDERGIIRKYDRKKEKLERIERERKKDSIIGYKFDFAKYPTLGYKIFNILRTYISFDFAYKLFYEMIQKDEFSFISRRVSTYDETNIKYNTCRYRLSDMLGMGKFNSLYDFVTPVYGELKPLPKKETKKERCRKYYEQVSAENKRRKESERKREMENQKSLSMINEPYGSENSWIDEMEANITTIERLGFDKKTSFRKC